MWFVIFYMFMIILVKIFWFDELCFEIFLEIEEVFFFLFYICCNLFCFILYFVFYMFYMWIVEMILICMF